MTTLIDNHSIILNDINQNAIIVLQYFHPIDFNTRMPILDVQYDKTYRCPHNIEKIVPKDRRNKKRIIDNDRNITPFSSYYH